MESTMTLKTWLVDTAEKAGSTLVEAALVYAIAAQAIDSEFWKGLVVAVVIAVTNVLKQALTTWMPQPKDWRLDMITRALWTFLVSAVGSLASVTWFDLINLTFWRGVTFAGLTAAASVLKSVVAKQKPSTITPASLVSKSSVDVQPELA